MTQNVRLLGRIAPMTLCLAFFVQGALAQDTSTASEAAPVEASSTSTSEVPVSEEELATARLHFQNGVELLQAEPPNYQDAYRQFELALEKSGRSWKVLGNLGFCALKLERDGEALAYYDEYLRRGDDKIDPREKESIERETLLARGNLVTVTIESSDPEARISVERVGSTAPIQIYDLKGGRAEIGLRSGTLTIVAKSGEKSLEWKQVLDAGDSASHLFDFDAPVATEAAASPSSPPARAIDESSRGMSPLRLTGIIAAGVGVATLGGGVVLGVLSQSKESSARDKCVQDTCLEATENEFDSAKSMASVANVLFIAGGVLTAAGVTLFIVGGNSPSEKATAHRERPGAVPHLAVSPLVAPGGAGVFAHGTF